MNLVHIGLVSSSAENADRFYGELLGLPKTRHSALSEELASQVFGISAPGGCEIVYYGEHPLVFEVFLLERRDLPENKISHTCIEVPDRAEFLGRCREMGFDTREVAREGRGPVVFIEDADGNAFEVMAPLGSANSKVPAR
jgi:catechol 2,3-dioxygenase-like lactoylglutathione lyase family enzyme